MKTIKNSKEITTLEVGDKVVFGDLEYEVAHSSTSLDDYYYLDNLRGVNDVIFERLNINKKDFVEKLGIAADCSCDFPEVKSLEALTAVVSALFKEYEKPNKLPKTWEEFCNKYPITPRKEAFINTASRIMVYEDSRITRLVNDDKNLCTSKQEAEAFLALMQLRQLRKAYVKDWEPDWKDTKQCKACIIYHSTDFMFTYFKDSCSRPLSFPTKELANQFLNNFKDLLEIAKPLI